MGKVVAAIGDVIESAVDLVVNTVTGVIESVADFAVGVVTGDFKKAFGALFDIITVVAVAFVIVSSGFALLPIMAGIVVLDAKYNGSMFLRSVLGFLGAIENITFGTDFINEYTDIIVGALVLVSTFYIGQQAFQYLQQLEWIKGLHGSYSSLFDAWKTLGKVMSGYDIYSSVKGILESKEYWDNLLREYIDNMQNYINTINQARAQWFDIYSDTETIGRVLAGGDVYNAGAGSELYSISDAYEPYRYQTGIVSQYVNDETDKMVNHNRYYYGMAGSDAYLENLLKGK